jgi:hypothetical protein
MSDGGDDRGGHGSGEEKFDVGDKIRTGGKGGAYGVLDDLEDGVGGNVFAKGANEERVKVGG